MERPSNSWFTNTRRWLEKACGPGDDGANIPRLFAYIEHLEAKNAELTRTVQEQQERWERNK